MFEEELPSVIENYFNENLAQLSFLKIQDVKINAINNATGKVYINCTQQGTNKFMELSCSDLKNPSNYQTLSENVSKMSFSTENNKGETVQEKDLADKIASYALEQDKVLEYMINNGIDYSKNSKVLNATEFEAKGGYRQTDVTVIVGNNVLKISLSGRAGTCSTQEEYLQKFKNGYLEKVEVKSCENFKELEVVSSAEASSQKTFVCTFPDDYNDLLKGNTFTTNSGDLQFV